MNFLLWVEMDYPIVEPILELKYFEIWGFKVHSLDSKQPSSMEAKCQVLRLN